MDFLYNIYDTTALVACLGSIILTVILLAAFYWLYYSRRDEREGR